MDDVFEFRETEREPIKEIIPEEYGKDKNDTITDRFIISCHGILRGISHEDDDEQIRHAESTGLSTVEPQHSEQEEIDNCPSYENLERRLLESENLGPIDIKDSVHRVLVKN